MLEGLSLSLSYSRPILRQISLVLEAGERIALLGASGSGKTTLLKILAGLLSPDEGTVTCDGSPREFLEKGSTLTELEDAKWVWPRVTLVFQDVRLFPNLSARENCLLGLPASESVNHHRNLESLADHLFVQHCLDQKPRQMSQGEQQRVAIMRALIRRPTYLLLDEPTAALDPMMRLELAKMLMQRSKETAILFSTHDWEFASHLANRFLIIRQARLTSTQTLHEAVDALTDGSIDTY